MKQQIKNYRRMHRSLLLNLFRKNVERRWSWWLGKKRRVGVPPELSEAEFERWAFENGTFRANWFTFNIPNIYPAIAHRTIDRVLEIGSYEGLSATWFSRFTKGRATITCVDPFLGSIEHQGDQAQGLEETFDRNITALAVNPDVVRKIKGPSHEVVPRLIKDSEQFDLIYLDGSHAALDVLVDACLCWKVLRPGGIMIFDDYLWDAGSSEKDRPLLGVNKFLDVVSGEFNVVWAGYQVGIEKR